MEINIINMKQISLKELKTELKKMNYKPGNRNKETLYNEYVRLKKYISSSIIIQKYFRRFLIYSFIKCSGPAYYDRDLCINIEDLLTLDNIKNINPYEFISYTDTSGYIYGAEIQSLKQTIQKYKYNPYNRNKFDDKIVIYLEKKIRINKILNKYIYHDDKHELSILELFQRMDSLGNITKVEWVTNLNTYHLKKLILELYDIWNYRANLTLVSKCIICPTNNGNPFKNIDMPKFFSKSNVFTHDVLMKNLIIIIDNIVNLDANETDRVIGSYLVLSSLTNVSTDAALCMPWFVDDFY